MHAEGDVIGGGLGALHLGVDLAGADGEGADLALLGVVAATAKAGADAQPLKPFHEAAAPPRVAAAALGAEAASDGLGLSGREGSLAHGIPQSPPMVPEQRKSKAITSPSVSVPRS